jgi:hypothetical protein
MQEHIDANSTVAEPSKRHPLPYVALTLTFIAPIIIAGISGGQAFFYAAAMLSPLAGMVTAIIALCLGKKRIGAGGKIISIIVIAVPLCIIGVIAALFFVSTNGAFVLHM